MATGDATTLYATCTIDELLEYEGTLQSSIQKTTNDLGRANEENRKLKAETKLLRVELRQLRKPPEANTGLNGFIAHATKTANAFYNILTDPPPSAIALGKGQYGGGPTRQSSRPCGSSKRKLVLHNNNAHTHRDAEAAGAAAAENTPDTANEARIDENTCGTVREPAYCEVAPLFSTDQPENSQLLNHQCPGSIKSSEETLQSGNNISIGDSFVSRQSYEKARESSSEGTFSIEEARAKHVRPGTGLTTEESTTVPRSTQLFDNGELRSFEIPLPASRWENSSAGETNLSEMEDFPSSTLQSTSKLYYRRGNGSTSNPSSCKSWNEASNKQIDCSEGPIGEAEKTDLVSLDPFAIEDPEGPQRARAMDLERKNNEIHRILQRTTPAVSSDEDNGGAIGCVRPYVASAATSSASLRIPGAARPKENISTASNLASSPLNSAEPSSILTSTQVCTPPGVPNADSAIGMVEDKFPRRCPDPINAHVAAGTDLTIEAMLLNRLDNSGISLSASLCCTPATPSQVLPKSDADSTSTCKLQSSDEPVPESGAACSAFAECKLDPIVKNESISHSSSVESAAVGQLQEDCEKKCSVSVNGSEGRPKSACVEYDAGPKNRSRARCVIEVPRLSPAKILKIDMNVIKAGVSVTWRLDKRNLFQNLILLGNSRPEKSSSRSTTPPNKSVVRKLASLAEQSGVDISVDPLSVRVALLKRTESREETLHLGSSLLWLSPIHNTQLKINYNDTTEIPLSTLIKAFPTANAATGSTGPAFFDIVIYASFAQLTTISNPAVPNGVGELLKRGVELATAPVSPSTSKTSSPLDRSETKSTALTNSSDIEAYLPTKGMGFPHLRAGRKVRAYWDSHNEVLQWFLIGKYTPPFSWWGYKLKPSRSAPVRPRLRSKFPTDRTSGPAGQSSPISAGQSSPISAGRSSPVSAPTLGTAASTTTTSTRELVSTGGFERYHYATQTRSSTDTLPETDAMNQSSAKEGGRGTEISVERERAPAIEIERDAIDEGPVEPSAPENKGKEIRETQQETQSEGARNCVGNSKNPPVIPPNEKELLREQLSGFSSSDFAASKDERHPTNPAEQLNSLKQSSYNPTDARLRQTDALGVTVRGNIAVQPFMYQRLSIMKRLAESSDQTLEAIKEGPVLAKQGQPERRAPNLQEISLETYACVSPPEESTILPDVPPLPLFNSRSTVSGRASPPGPQPPVRRQSARKHPGSLDLPDQSKQHGDACVKKRSRPVPKTVSLEETTEMVHANVLQRQLEQKWRDKALCLQKQAIRNGVPNSGIPRIGGHREVQSPRERHEKYYGNNRAWTESLHDFAHGKRKTAEYPKEQQQKLRGADRGSEQLIMILRVLLKSDQPPAELRFTSLCDLEERTDAFLKSFNIKRPFKRGLLESARYLKKAAHAGNIVAEYHPRLKRMVYAQETDIVDLLIVE